METDSMGKLLRSVTRERGETAANLLIAFTVVISAVEKGAGRKLIVQQSLGMIAAALQIDQAEVALLVQAAYGEME